MLDEISTSVHSRSLDETFQMKFRFKGREEEMMLAWGVRTPTSSLWKVKTKGVGHQLQAPFEDQPRKCNETCPVV
jgi:hypothetical protein